MTKKIDVSICIVTYDRQDYLTNLLNALRLQTFSNFEIIIVEAGDLEKTRSIMNNFISLDIQAYKQLEKGLVNARNEAWKKAKGNIICFVDDDIIPEHIWLETIMDTFSAYKDIGGVGGPGIIPKELLSLRETTSLLSNKNNLFKKIIKIIYFKFFLENRELDINKFFKSGVFSLGALIPDVVNDLDGPIEVEFLDPCQMCFRLENIRDIGGFDPIFIGFGYHSEPDISFRMRNKGYRLLFNNKAIVYHYPSERGIYKGSRIFHYQRGRNLSIFSRRYIGISLSNILYVTFLSMYCISKFISDKNQNWLAEINGLIVGYLRYNNYEMKYNK